MWCLPRQFTFLSWVFLMFQLDNILLPSTSYLLCTPQVLGRYLERSFATKYQFQAARGGVIVMAESRKKKTLKMAENWKRGNRSEKRSVPETGKWHFWVTANPKTWKYLRKTENCWNQTSVLKSHGKGKKKTMKSGGNRKTGKKLRKAGKATKFLRKAGNGPPITPPQANVMLLKQH